MPTKRKARPLLRIIRTVITIMITTIITITTTTTTTTTIAITITITTIAITMSLEIVLREMLLRRTVCVEIVTLTTATRMVIMMRTKVCSNGTVLIVIVVMIATATAAAMVRNRILISSVCLPIHLVFQVQGFQDSDFEILQLGCVSERPPSIESSSSLVDPIYRD